MSAEGYRTPSRVQSLPCVSIIQADAWDEPTCNLEVANFVNQKVLRLQVAMQDAVGMTVVQALDKLVAEFLGIISVIPSLQLVFHVDLPERYLG